MYEKNEMIVVNLNFECKIKVYCGITLEGAEMDIIMKNYEY